MTEPNRHRSADCSEARRAYRRRVLARGGMAGALLVGFGFAVQDTATTAGQGATAGAADLVGRDSFGAAAGRDLVREPLTLPVEAVAPIEAVAHAPEPVVTRDSFPKVDLTAIRRAERYVGTRHHWAHLCLGFVRTTYRLPGHEGSAIRAWRAAHHKHHGDRNPPAGVPVFWSGGSRGRGHVAFSLGDGWIISTDLPHAGHISKVRLSKVSRTWGLHYLGWTEDLEGVRIYLP